MIRHKTYRGYPKPRIVAKPIQVNCRSTKFDAGKLKLKYLNRPWSTLAVNVLIFSVRSKPRITETADTESVDTSSSLLVCVPSWTFRMLQLLPAGIYRN
jgi:hypothetical protein